MNLKEIKRHPVVCFGETLWDLLPSGKLAGGAPMNVAYHLQKMGKDPAMISRIGNDDLGKELIEVLHAKNICTDFIQVDQTKPTSVVQAEIGINKDVLYTIVEDVAWDHIEWQDTLSALVKEADYFVFGSLAARSRQTFETLSKLLPLAKNKVLDINLRPPFYDREKIEWLLVQATLLKLNLEELTLITRWYTDLYSTEEQVKFLQDKFHLDTMIVTMGAKGALISDGEGIYSCPGIAVRVEDTIGSGDSFLAAVISKIMDGASIKETLDYANQLAAYVTTQKGACPDYYITSKGFITEIIQNEPALTPQ